jgi:hypothetical protein
MVVNGRPIAYEITGSNLQKEKTADIINRPNTNDLTKSNTYQETKER